MWETWVRSLGLEDPLEKELATHSSIPAWKIPWMEEPGRLLSMGLQRVGHDWMTNTLISCKTWLYLRWAWEAIICHSIYVVAPQVAQTVRHLPAMWETWIRSPGWEDPLEKELATHSSTLAWKIPWMEESGRLQSMGSQRVRLDWTTSLVHIVNGSKFLFCFSEVNFL